MECVELMELMELVELMELMELMELVELVERNATSDLLHLNQPGKSPKTAIEAITRGEQASCYRNNSRIAFINTSSTSGATRETGPVS